MVWIEIWNVWVYLVIEFSILVCPRPWKKWLKTVYEMDAKNGK